MSTPQDDNVMILHYAGKEYTNLGDIPFPSVGFGDVLNFQYEIENKSTNSLGEFELVTNAKPVLDSRSGELIEPFKATFPDTIPALNRAMANILIDGTALFRLDASITTITMGIRYAEQRVFR